MEKVFFKKSSFSVSALFSLVLFIIFNTSAYANEESDKIRYTITSNPSLAVGLSGSISDSNFDVGNLLINPRTLVKLGLDGSYTSNYTISIDITITPLLQDQTPGTGYNKSLNIEYNSLGGVQNIDDFVVHEIVGSRGADITVNSISVVDDGGNALAVIPDNLYLELEYAVERYYPLSDEVPQPSAGVFSNNEIKISWPALIGAEEYELEWTWIDNYDEDNTRVLDESQISLTTREFNLNNTRIQTEELSYIIPPIFGSGYLVYRVRAVGRFMSNISKNYYGFWSSGINTKRTVASWPHVRTIIPHEVNKNWQYQSSYAEDGKKKEVVSYFDGTLRNRQTVTKINTNNQAIVGEVIYDNQGRPAVEVLPVPIDNTEIKFHEDQSRNSQGSVYTHRDFDWNDVNNLSAGTITDFMNTASGASKYYSNNNTVQNNWQDFVPDAEGYPFSQIEYTPDNTGRIRRKSGVGANHQLGSGHEMKYYYLTPGQSELNRLFGYRVGNAIHYKKNLVVDPNGQVSVSYIDPQGRTIATALAGNSPVSLEALNEEVNGNHDIFFTDILNKQNVNDADTDLDNNQRFSTGRFGALEDGLQVSKQIGVVTPLIDYNFNYTFSNATSFQPFIPQGCTIGNYSFEYDLKIALTDENAENKFLEEQLRFNSAEQANNTLQLDIGTYSLSKDLRINEQALEQHVEDYINKVRECITVENFSPNADLTGCFEDYDSCISSLGTKEEYVDQKLLEEEAIDTNNNILIDQETYLLLKQLYEDQYESLVKACEETYQLNLNVSCQNGLELLLADVSPGGQYGSTLLTEDTDLVADPLSVFNDNSQLYYNNAIEGNNWRNPTETYKNDFGDESFIIVTLNSDGTYFPEVSVTPTENTDGELQIRPEQLANVSDFISFWQDSWAQSLVKFHPEFCYFEYADAVCGLESTVNIFPFKSNPGALSGTSQLINSDTYNEYLNTIEKFDQAVTAGILIPNSITGEKNIFNFDPYFSNSLPTQFQTITDNRAAIMLEAIETQYGEFTDMTMLEVAYKTIVCNSITTCNQTFNGLSTIAGISDEDTRDRIWTTFRSFYQSLKAKINYVYANVYAKEEGCYNGCIGPDTDNRDIAAVLKGYSQQSDIANYISSNTNTSLGACNTTNSLLYAAKEKRYIPIDALADGHTDINADTNGGDYEAYQQTGKCPLAFDLEAFLNGFVKQEENNIPITIVGSNDYVGQYLVRDLYEAFGGIANSQSSTINFFNATVNGSTLEINMAGIFNNVPVSLTLPASFAQSWSNYNPSGTWFIRDFSNIYYESYSNATNEFSFQILAQVQINGQISEIVLTGTTNAAIGECGTENDGLGDVLTPSDNPYLNPPCECPGDIDCDGVADDIDLCPATYDPTNSDSDGDGLGDVCQDFLCDSFFEEDEMLFESIIKDAFNEMISVRARNADYTNSILPKFRNDYELFERLIRYEDQIYGVGNNDLRVNWRNISRLTGSLSFPGNDINTLELIFSEREQVGTANGGPVYRIDQRLKMSFNIPVDFNDLNVVRIESLDISSSGFTRVKVLLADGNIEDREVNTLENSLVLLFTTPNSHDIDFCLLNSLRPGIFFRTSTSKATGENLLPALGIDGSFESCYDFIRDDFGTNHNVACAGWININSSDTRKIGIPTFTMSEVETVPNGDVYVASYTNTGILEGIEGFYKNITGLTPGQKYTLTFYQANGLQVPYPRDVEELPEFSWWQITFGDEIKNSSQRNWEENPTWNKEEIIFTAQSETQVLRFMAMTSEISPESTVVQAFMYMDDIQLFEGDLTVNNPTPDTPCEVCIPQTVAPVSCTDKYDIFINNALPLVADYTLPDYFDEEYFCNLNYAYITDSYVEFLTQLGVTTTDDFNFLTIAEFGDTDLNYGYANINNVIAQYAGYNADFAGQGAVEERLTWREYVNTEYAPTSVNCPPAPFPVIPSDIITIDYNDEEDNNCVQINANVNADFSSDSYENYLNSLRERFTREYIQQAMETAIENFTESHIDKEYQYTLYYYDQAGNLTQTVAPQGVQRIEDANNEAINAYRANNPTGEDLTNADGDVINPSHNFKTQYKYNSLNQLVWQSTPDGGITRFAYDKLGRIIASQNAKQAANLVNGNHDLSYTKYDGLGRITEAGQVQVASDYIINENGKLVGGPGLIEATLDEAISNAASAGVREDVSITIYDKPIQGTASYFENFNNDSRNRVTAVLYFDEISGAVQLTTDYDNAIFYDYDVHGNVKEIVRRVNDPVLIQKRQDLKKTQYEYDLISGNVNRVYYQKNQADQFIHSYEYDADNRITSVKTSNDGVIWENDASYHYYDHGPLARTVLGDQKVQGMDYAYTLQGWLKMVNAEHMNLNYDIGLDSKTNNNYTNGDVGRDAMGYSLSYFNGDYKPRLDRGTEHSKKNPLIYSIDNNFPQNNDNLYNGNIKTMVTAFLNQNEAVGGVTRPRLNHYKYDQLNRIQNFQAYDVRTNGRSDVAESASYGYDKNGNLGTLNRDAKRGGGVNSVRSMDQLEYDYVAGKNQLQLVRDNQTNVGRFATDIDNHTTPYAYDEIGQLTADIDEGIQNIEWTVSGKVDKVTKTNGNVISFVYDALGNRLSKTLDDGTSKTTTYYMRDAQGNVMSVYELMQNSTSSTYRLLEQHIYGSSRLGLQQEALELDENSTGIVKSNASAYALQMSPTYEAEWTDEHPFKLVNDEYFSFKTKLTLINQANNQNYWSHVAQFDHEDPDAPNILYQLLVGMYEYQGIYYPSFSLRQQIDNVSYSDKEFFLTNGTASTEMDIDFKVTIVDKEQDLYEAQLTVNGQTYTQGNGVSLNLNEGPFTQQHYPATDRLSWNVFDPLEYDIDYLSTDINGKKQDFTFNEGAGAPVSNDSISVQLNPDATNWLKRLTLPSNDYIRETGDKRYELANHLGNVLSVVSDRKIVRGNRFAPDVLSYNDYYPFGMLIPTRSFDSPEYRYGFQGQEKDDELKGNGNSINYKYRMHDPRVGRFLSLDPLSSQYPNVSPFAFSENRVIDGVELEGAELWRNKVQYSPKEGVYYSGGTALQKVVHKDNDNTLQYTLKVLRNMGVKAHNNLNDFFNYWAISGASDRAKDETLGTVKRDAITAYKSLKRVYDFYSNDPTGMREKMLQSSLNSSFSKKLTTSEVEDLGGDAISGYLGDKAIPKLPVRAKSSRITSADVFTTSIATRELAQTYALTTKKYKNYIDYNDIKTNNEVFDLVDNFGNVVDVTTTINLSSPSNFYRKIRRLSNIEVEEFNIKDRTLQIYLKKGDFNADQIKSFKLKLEKFIKLNELKTKISVDEIKD